mgnify:CR=1 FL=1
MGYLGVVFNQLQAVAAWVPGYTWCYPVRFGEDESESDDVVRSFVLTAASAPL